MEKRITDRACLNAERAAYGKCFELQKKRILVCGGTGCVAGGSLDIYAELIRLIKEKGIACDVELAEEPHGETVGVKKSGCHGFCEMGPLVRIDPYGYLYTKVKIGDCAEIVEKTIVGDECVDRLAYKKDGVIYREQENIPFYKNRPALYLNTAVT